jgi:hypothetical protein
MGFIIKLAHQKGSKSIEVFYRNLPLLYIQQNIEELGESYDDFLQVDLAGWKVLFNGDPIPDEELPTLSIKGRDFATELTNGKFTKEDITLDTVKQINEEYHQEVPHRLSDSRPEI